ncbi:MAG: sarcosine oxidase subunit delta [Burkholderiaceae bacterium]
MLALYCPFCQSTRDEQEFACLGEAFVERPENPDMVSDAAWADYLFMRTNTKGWLWEQWQHRAGCTKIFAVRRHTVTYEIAGSWTLAEARLQVATAAAHQS